MSLTLKSREVSGVTVLDPTGKITLGEGGQALRDEARLHLAQGVRGMVLNLAEVSYIDSSGLGELVSACTAMKNLGGELKLISLTHKVRDLLVITKLVTVFDVKENEAAAVASFA